MADILLVDSNPEHVRSLGGLVKYRTNNALDVAPDIVTALRRIHVRKPDLVLVNVLQYVSEDFGFARALNENPDLGTIRVLTHVSGRVEAITRRRIEAFGAKLVELPLAADELQAELVRPQSPAPTSGDDIRTVSWTKVAEKETTAEVRAVNWAVDGGAPPQRTEPRAPRSTPRPRPKKASRGPRPTQPPKPTQSHGTSFTSLADGAERVDAPDVFKPARETNWEEVKPEEVKNKRRRFRKS